MSEGYIKFNCIWSQEEFRFQEELYLQLEAARTELHQLGLIGRYANGIGFGNLSVKSGLLNEFIISGSATGGFERLRKADYALVPNYQIDQNILYCSGLTQASSESLTHAAVYESLPEIRSVVHVHCGWLWEKLRNIYPTTSAEIEYGTPQMAEAVGTIAKEIQNEEQKIIVMGGHPEGILSFGNNLKEACTQIINSYNRYKHD